MSYTLSLHDALPISFPLSAADLPPSPTKSSNLSETAEVPACNVPSRSPLPALAIAPETKLGTLSHLGFLAGQIGRLITISTTPVIAGDSFEMDAVGALRLSPLRRGLAIDSTVDIFTFYVPHRHVYGEQWIKFMKDGVNATPLPTVNTT